MAAEYIVAAGNPNVILCERGIRTFETYTRNTLDLAAVPVLHQLTHLPVIVDPSHATGKRWLVAPLALGGVAVGADGVMVEVHPDPDAALSDAEQQLNLEPVRGADARPGPGPRAGPRPARRRRASRRPTSTPAPGGGRAVEALSAMTAQSLVRRPAFRRRRRAGRTACAASCGCPATSRSAIGRSCSRRSPTARADITGAGDGADVRSTAAICGALGAAVERARGRRPATSTTGSRSPGVDGLREPRRPRLRQLRHEPPAVRRASSPGCRSGRVLDGDDSLRRRPVARIIEPLRSMGATLHGRRQRLPPAADRDRSATAPGGRLVDPGPERAGQVGDPAGGAPGGGPDDGARGGRDARSHRADAAGPRRDRTDATAGADRRCARSRSREGRRCRRSTSASRATCPRPRSGSSPARSIRTPT